MSARETPLSHSFCQHVVETSEPLVVEDARDHPLVRDNLAVSELGVIAYAGMPIKTSDGLILGSLCAVDTRPREWTEEELSSLALAAESLNAEVALRERLLTESQLRSQLETAKLEAERALAVKDRLLASVSHELRTPLSGVLGFAELLDDERLDEEQRSFLDTVRRSADTLLHVVDGLIHFVDLESTPGSAMSSPFRPSELLTEVVRATEDDPSAEGISLSVLVDADVPEVVLGDPERMRSVLAELLANACRFTDRGEVTVSAAIAGAVGEDFRLSIEVRDTGLGIAPDRLEEIFEPLTGHDGSGGRTRGGSGLGLAVVRHHVGSLGGEIQVESTPEEGSAFTVSVPIGVPPDRRG